MKHTHYEMLPLRAFNARGSVIGGRSMQLHGGDSWYEPPRDPSPYGYWSGGGDAGATWVETAPPANAGYVPVTTGGGDAGTTTTWEPAPAPAPAPDYGNWAPPPSYTPDWTQTVNNIYQQMLGRQPDPSGMATFTNLLNLGWSDEQIRGAISSSAEYQQRQAAAQPPAPAPAPASAYTPFNVDQFGGYKLGEQQSDQHIAYANAARLANYHMSLGNPKGYAQQFIDQANDLKAHLSQPFRIDTVSVGSGDGGTSTETVFVTPGGSQSVVRDEQTGQYVANIIGSGSGESGGSNIQGAVIDIPALVQQQQTAQTKPYGTGMGPALGYAYGMKNADGNIYRKFDAQGNLTEYLDQDGVFQPASGVKPAGTRFNPETAQMDTVYSFGQRQGDIVGNSWVPNMSVYREDRGGWLGEGGWLNMAKLAATALLTIYGPAIWASIAGPAEVTSTAGGFLGADIAATTALEASTVSLADALGMGVNEAVSGGFYQCRRQLNRSWRHITNGRCRYTCGSNGWCRSGYNQS